MTDNAQSDITVSPFEQSDDRAEEMPEIYLNGFEVAFSLSDINIITITNGRRRYRLLMSFTTAKTLLAQLAMTMEALEKNTGQTIMTMDNIKVAMDKANKRPNK